jgi:glycosyltransferase involved in cell wall biosynthesis
VRCSFIVSAFDRPDALACLLYSLKIQTEPDFEVIVTDNSDGNMRRVTESLVEQDSRFRYALTAKENCYESANETVSMARGDYLCFPSDDNYYVPRFLELMLRGDADLTYCDMVYDPRGGDSYRVVDARPNQGFIDKGGFLVRRGRFIRFPWQRSLGFADGMMIEDLVTSGVTHIKVRGVLWVHN